MTIPAMLVAAALASQTPGNDTGPRSLEVSVRDSSACIRKDTLEKELERALEKDRDYRTYALSIAVAANEDAGVRHIQITVENRLTPGAAVTRSLDVPTEECLEGTRLTARMAAKAMADAPAAPKPPDGKPTAQEPPKPTAPPAPPPADEPSPGESGSKGVGAPVGLMVAGLAALPLSPLVMGAGMVLVTAGAALLVTPHVTQDRSGELTVTGVQSFLVPLLLLGGVGIPAAWVLSALALGVSSALVASGLTWLLLTLRE